MALSQKQELDIAYQRKLAGGADYSPTDKKNLEYAQSKGLWSPPSGENLTGTLPDVGTISDTGAQLPDTTERTLGDSSSQLSDMKSVLKNIARQEAPKDSVNDILERYKSSGLELSPQAFSNAMTTSIIDPSQKLSEKYSEDLTSVVDIIQKREETQQGYLQSVLGQLDFVLSPKEYQELLNGSMSDELKVKIAESDARQQATTTTSGANFEIKELEDGTTVKHNKSTGEYEVIDTSSQQTIISANFNQWQQGIGKITQDFDTPVSYFTDGRTTHSGLDIAGAIDSPVTAPISGTVVGVLAEADSGGFGNTILIEDGDGNTWKMSHFNKMGVKKGDTVSSGQQIGLLGNTGYVLKGDGKTPTQAELASGSGSHLHIEVKDKNGNFIRPGSTDEDPSKYSFNEEFSYNEKIDTNKLPKLGGAKITDKSARQSNLPFGITSKQANWIMERRPGNIEFQRMKSKDYEKIGALLELREDLIEIREFKKNVNTGPLASRSARSGRWAGLEVGEFTNLEIKTGKQLAEYIKNISGAAVSEEEAQRLARNIPNVVMQDNQFIIALDDYEDDLNALISTVLARYNFEDEDAMRDAVGLNKELIKSDDSLGLSKSVKTEDDPMGIK